MGGLIILIVLGNLVMLNIGSLYKSKEYSFFYNNNSLLNVQFGSLLGPHGLLLIYMWGENST
jgi:hypothetical protein